jgi:acyl-CoA thioesterase I
LRSRGELREQGSDEGVLAKLFGGDVERLSRAEIEEAVQYHHPEKRPAALPTRPEIRNDMLAPFFGVDARTYEEIKAAIAGRARRCARELLQDARFGALVDRLPFEPGTTVVGTGDSITDDYHSWLEILRHLLAERRPDDRIEVVNAGISGDTTSQLLGRFLEVLEEKPNWLITLIGTNDVFFVREPLTKNLVSPEETAKNLRTLRDLAKARGGMRLAWITPPPGIEDRQGPSPAGRPVWRNADLAEVARLVREVAGEDPLVDLWEVFGDPAEPELLLPDGLHPSLGGQRAIAVALVERLASA